jgi:hypothetical protein
MKRFLTPVLGAAVAVAASGGILLAAGSAQAATPPPWEPDHSSVGGLNFYDSSGHVVTSGSTSNPISAYAEGTATVRNGDNVATLFGYLPVSGETPGQWSGEQLSGSTAYPNASAPAPLNSASLPVVSGKNGDETVAELVADFPNTGSGAYAHLYQIRLLTSKAQEGISTVYDSADISVTGSSWSVVYSNGGGTATATSVKLAVKPAGPVRRGAKVTLTATVTPAAVPGKVQFLDGSKVLKSVSVSGGTATDTESSLSAGKHHLIARFVPSGTTYAQSTSSAHSITVKGAPTSVKLKASASKIAAGKKLTLKAVEKPKVAGKVTFFDGSKKVGKPVKVRAGKATVTTTKLKKGSHSLKAKFTPKSKADYAASTSRVVTVKVTG